MNPSKRTPMGRDTSDKSMMHTRDSARSDAQGTASLRAQRKRPLLPALPVERSVSSLRVIEASGAVVHDGVIRPSAEQKLRGRAVQLPVEPDQADCKLRQISKIEASLLALERYPRKRPF